MMKFPIHGRMKNVPNHQPGTEIVDIPSGDYLLRMMIFHSYVRLPEGILLFQSYFISYTLSQFNITMEKCHLQLVYPLKMVTFHNYVVVNLPSSKMVIFLWLCPPEGNYTDLFAGIKHIKVTPKAT